MLEKWTILEKISHFMKFMNFTWIIKYKKIINCSYIKNIKRSMYLHFWVDRDFRGKTKTSRKFLCIKSIIYKIQSQGKTGENIFSEYDNGVIALLHKEILPIYKKNMKTIINSKKCEQIIHIRNKRLINVWKMDYQIKIKITLQIIKLSHIKNLWSWWKCNEIRSFISCW